MWNATIGAEELANISSYQTLSADKNSKTYEARTKLKNNTTIISNWTGQFFASCL